jgi:CheY-like chemotaxis protein
MDSLFIQRHASDAHEYRLGPFDLTLRSKCPIANIESGCGPCNALKKDTLCKPNCVTANEDPASASGARVLLVDDEYDDAMLLADQLALLGASVGVARSANEALAILDQQFVDLVVTDLNMPGGSGLDLVRALRGCHDVPAVIFMTGSMSVRDKAEAFALGAVAYLTKPVDVGHLIALAGDILGSRCAKRARDAAVANTSTVCDDG